MKVGIIGAGISGLSAAYYLAKAGHDVHVFQKEDTTGGLLATFDFDGLRIEHFYHFLCGTDEGYFGLAKELGLYDQVKFQTARTGFYYQGKRYGFTSPVDLLRFTPIPLTQRIRFGLFALEARWRQEWAQLDALTAKPWLIDRLGYRTYDVVWHPLLGLKFGDFHDKISAAWVWHRIHRVAKSKGKMGYLEGGTQLLLDTLADRIREMGATLHTSTPVEQIVVRNKRVRGVQINGGEEFPCERVISTVPLSVVAGLLPEGWDDYAADLRRTKYIGVVCLSFKLKRRVSPYFWLNVNDTRVPFNGIIEYTNLNPLRDHDCHVIYVPYYVATDHPYYKMDEEALFQQSWEAIKLISPGLTDEHLIAWHAARAPFAQAITPTGFLNMLPDQKTPIQGLRLLDSTFLYPEDRTQSGHITKAQECAATIEEA